MAKIRRIIRKLKPTAAQAFDDQLWPVLLALCVLGGFIMGSIIAYLRFDDPRWYANAITWLVLTVVGVGSVAAALAFIDNRVFRRGMQLAVVLCLFLHATLFVASVELKIFGRIFDALIAENDLSETRQPITVPEYFQAERRDQTRRDFERPVETETPEPDPAPDEIERQEIEEEETPSEPQPTPVPEPENTVRPNVLRREQPEETAPRYSEQQSRLSRRLTQTQPTPPSARADSADVERAQTRPSSLQAADSSVARQETAAQAQRRIAPMEPSTTQQQQTVQIARRENDQTLEPQSAAAPTARRQIDRAIAVPRTEVELADTPATSQRTNPNELRPHTTLARRQMTTSPDANRSDQQPVPDTTTPVTNQSQRRQLRTEERPTIAETPVPVSNRRTRATPRPDLATAAANVTPADTPRPPRPESTQVEATTSPVRRTNTQLEIERRTVASQPPTASQQNAARIARRQTRQIPTNETNVADTLTPRRQNRRPTVASSTLAQTTQPAPVANDSQTNRLQPTATAASRQATANAAVARAEAQPTPNAPEATPAPATASSATRQPRAESAPAVAQAVRSLPNRRPQPAVRPSTDTMAANVTAPATPQAGPATAAPQAVAGAVGRRQTDVQIQRSGATAEAAAGSQEAGTARTARRQTADAPAAQPSAPEVAAATPRRQVGRTAVTPSTTAQAAGPVALATTTPAAAGGPTAQATSPARQATSGSAAGQTTGAPDVAAPSPTAAGAASQIARRETVTGADAVAAASAPGSTPRRQTTTPSIAPGTSADAAQTPSVAAGASDSTGQVAASPTATARQATANSLAARTGAQPAVAAATLQAAGGASRSATRLPRGADAPNLAQARVSSLARRQSTTALPSAANVTANVAANMAPTRGASDQPRPSSATVARAATGNPSAARSQQALDVQAASPSTEIARATTRRAASTGGPSINPDASPSPRPARTAMQSAIEASPTNVESPAVAEATHGVGNPAAAPARTALSRAVTGVAGVGRGRNLARANPAADSPAMIASASARRAESVQNTPPGPALSPTAPALVRRARAGADMPGASLEAEPLTQMATASGVQQPAELAANASAALSRADASATQGPVTGARGTTNVDLGPTRVVSEGGTSRASGGGQPAMNFETDSPRIARNTDIGGAPLASIAATTVVDAPTSPPSDAGGRPATPETEMQPTAVARADAGGGEPVSGGPARATQTGPPTEMSVAEEVAEAALSRAELAEALPGDDAAGGGTDEDEDEEERRRRLARAATRLALANTPTTADSADVAAAAATGQQPGAAAAATAIARAATGASDGSPAAGPQQAGPSGESATQLATGPTRRAEVPEDTPEGPAVLSVAANAVGRSAARRTVPATTTQAGAVDMSVAAGPGAAEVVASAGPAIERANAGATGTPTDSNAASVDVEPGGPQTAPTAGAARAQGNDRAPAVADASVSPQLARSSRLGAAPPTAIAASTVTPAGTGNEGPTGADPGGEQMAGPEPTALARADTTGTAPVTGGPIDPVSSGTETAAQAISPAAVGRVAASEAAPGAATAGGGQPDVDASLPIAHRIARRSGAGAPRLALAGPNPTSAAAAPAGDLAAGGGAAGSPLAGSDVNPEATATVRTSGGGNPAGGRPSYVVEAGPAGGASGGDLLAAAQFTRSETVEGAPGSPEVGGGTARPTRSAAGPAFAADTRADAVALAGIPASGGVADGSPIAAQGIDAARLAGGTRASPAHGPVGALAGETIVDVRTPGNPGLAIGTRGTSPSTDDGPAAGQTANRGAPLRRSTLNHLPTGSSTMAAVDVPGPGSFDPVAQATADHAVGDPTGALAMSRQSTEGGLAVNIDAPMGAGGLGSEYTVNVGLTGRRSRAESEHVQVRTARFVRQHIGGLPDFSTSAVVAAEPFRRRTGQTGPGGTGGGNGTPPPLTEETIELGLTWMARQQLPDGSWSLQGINNERTALVTDTSATGLALLAFQGAGYNHREHKYADVVNGGVQYLLTNQKENGDLFVPLDDESNNSVWFYSHSIALLALCEAYGMTQDPALREPVQKAIDFLVDAQNPDRGGWRYRPQQGSDTSVTGWAMMAMKSGELANLKVPEEAYAGIRRWLDKSMGSTREKHLYRYNPYAPNTEEQRHGRRPSKTMTSVGLLMRLYLGWRRDNANMARGAEYLAANPPSMGSTRDPQRDTYYWYYATQVMFHMGGDYWKAWNGRLHPLLVNTQQKQGPMAGSWDPRGPIPDRWAPHAGRLYVTAMNLLSLEVYYRHLPLYDDYAR